MPAVKTILGIDLRILSAKLIELENGLVINSAFASVPPSLLHQHPQLEDAKADILVNMIQEHKIKTKEAVVVVGGTDTVVKLFTLSSLPAAEVADAIKYKLSEELPFPIEEAIFDYYPISDHGTSEKVDYAAACINRRLYQEIKYTITRAGLKLAGIVVMPDVMHELFKKEIDEETGQINSVIYMGKRTTNISIFRNGNFEFNRELNIGGDTITQAMTGVLVSSEGRVEISPEYAEKLKTEYGIPISAESYGAPDIPIGQLQAMVRPALEKIQSEITRTFEYYKSQTGEAAIKKLIFTGGAAETLNLKEFLSEGLGIPIISPPLPSTLDTKLAGALGAAMIGASRINLLPEEDKYPWKPIIKKFMTVQFITAAVISFMVLVYGASFLWAVSMQNNLLSVNRRLAEYKPRLLQLENFEKASQEERDKQARFKQYEEKRTRFPRVFEEISALTPQAVYIDSLNMNPQDIKLAGHVFRVSEAAQTALSGYVIRLSSSPLLYDVQLIQVQKDEEFNVESFRFDIVAKVRSL